MNGSGNSQIARENPWILQNDWPISNPQNLVNYLSYSALADPSKQGISFAIKNGIRFSCGRLTSPLHTGSIP